MQKYKSNINVNFIHYLNINNLWGLNSTCLFNICFDWHEASASASSISLGCSHPIWFSAWDTILYIHKHIFIYNICLWFIYKYVKRVWWVYWLTIYDNDDHPLIRLGFWIGVTKHNILHKCETYIIWIKLVTLALLSNYNIKYVYFYRKAT